MMLKIAIAQHNYLLGDLRGNLAKIIDSANQARDKWQADVLVTSELALTGYPPEDLLLRPGMYERVETAMAELEKAVKGIDIIVGYPERLAQGIFNAAGLIQGSKWVASARKQNLPNYGVFDERRYFSSSQGPAAVVNIKGIPVGIIICEDTWYPQPAQQLKEAGARLILSLNASPYHINKGNERERVVAERANETGLPFIYINMVGGQDELVFDGDSFVMDKQGQIAQRLGMFEEELVLVKFDLQESEAVPQPVRPLPEPLSTEASVWQALVLGVRDFVRKNGFSDVVIGLSGGIDSALTLAVAVDALGPEHVEVVLMPSRYTADMSVEDAVKQAETQGVEHHIIPIEKSFNAFLETLQNEFAGMPVDTTEENIQARCRGVILMAISNKKGKMVLTTGNKSEMAVGYSTLYGDMAGGYDVLKDVPKILVFKLARYRNTLSEVIPVRVIERPPSAELAPDQQDTDSLPPYDILDAILERYVELDQGADDIIAAGYEAQTVERIIRMVDLNEYKRRQAPPGIRVTARAFGRDRRYPITSGYGRNRKILSKRD